MKTKTAINIKITYSTFTFMFLLIATGYSQNNNTAQVPVENKGCGTTFSKSQMKYIDKTSVERENYNSGAMAKTTTRIRIQCHVVRDNQGNQGIYSISQNQIDDAINTLNVNFANANIEFYQDNPINYINNSSLLNYDSNVMDEAWDYLTHDGLYSYDVSGRVNLYFFDILTSSSDRQCGIAFFPKYRLD